MGIDKMLHSKYKFCCNILKGLGGKDLTALSDQGVSMMKPMGTCVILEREPAQFRMMVSVVVSVVGILDKARKGQVSETHGSQLALNLLLTDVPVLYDISESTKG